jgi:hypothetical protein
MKYWSQFRFSWFYELQTSQNLDWQSVNLQFLEQETQNCLKKMQAAALKDGIKSSRFWYRSFEVTPNLNGNTKVSSTRLKTWRDIQ